MIPRENFALVRTLEPASARRFARADLDARVLWDEVKAEYFRLAGVNGGNELLIGQMFLEAKALAVHGQFERFVQEELGLSPSRAREYMRLARQPDALQLSALGRGKFAVLLGLSPELRAPILADPTTQTLSYRELRDRVAGFRSTRLRPKFSASARFALAALYLDGATTTEEVFSERYLLFLDFFRAQGFPEGTIATLRSHHDVLVQWFSAQEVK